MKTRQEFLAQAEHATKLVTLRCSETPSGRQKWSFRRLAETLIANGAIETISPEAVRQLLKKRVKALGWVKEWLIPSVDVDDVCAMEEMLDVSEREYEVNQPWVCLDESPKQLISAVRKSFTDSQGVIYEDFESPRFRVSVLVNRSLKFPN